MVTQIYGASLIGVLPVPFDGTFDFGFDRCEPLLPFSKRNNSTDFCGAVCDDVDTPPRRFVVAERLVIIAGPGECAPMGYHDRCDDGLGHEDVFAPDPRPARDFGRCPSTPGWCDPNVEGSDGAPVDVSSVSSDTVRRRRAEPDRWYERPWSCSDLGYLP